MASNTILESTIAEIAEIFEAYLEGDGMRPALILSEQPLGERAREALVKSFAAFGYLGDACTFGTLLPQGGGEGPALDAQAVFLLLEGLDPKYVVAADRASCDALGQAYRAEVEVNTAARSFGRNVVYFENLDSLMDTEAEKQKAWQLLKTLPL